MDRKEYQRQWQEDYRKDPDKANLVKIRQLTREALKAGEIQKKNCIVCGSEKSEMHHPDYSRPLLVEWLCRKHHMEKHPRKTVAKRETEKTTYPDVSIMNCPKCGTSLKGLMQQLGSKGGKTSRRTLSPEQGTGGKMKRYELIIASILLAAMCFFVGYRCGQDTEQLQYELSLDQLEGMQQ